MLGLSEEEWANLQDALKRAYDEFNNFCEEEQEECPYPESLIYPTYIVQMYIAPSLHSRGRWNIRDPPGVIRDTLISQYLGICLQI